VSALAVSSQLSKGFETLAEAAPGHVAHARSLVIDVLSQEQLRRLGRDADRIMSRIDTPAINEHYTSIPAERSADDRVDHLYGSPPGIHRIFLCARSWFGLTSLRPPCSGRSGVAPAVRGSVAEQPSSLRYRKECVVLS
jgi:hypothetical protein